MTDQPAVQRTTETTTTETTAVPATPDPATEQAQRVVADAQAQAHPSDPGERDVANPGQQDNTGANTGGTDTK